MRATARESRIQTHSPRATPEKVNRMPQSRFLPCLALTLLSLDAHALGIGEIVSQPRLGDRLRIEVRLLSDGQSQIDPACIKLAPGDNSDDLPWVRGARLRVQGGPRPTLIIESNEQVNHPIFLLGLRVGCGAEVKREFTLMPQAPIELPVASSPIPPQIDANRSHSEGVVTAASSDAGSGGWMTVEGETLSGIANALFPNSVSGQKDFIREAVRANPGLFRGVADPALHPLPGGESLALPGSSARKVSRSVSQRPKIAAKPRTARPPATAPTNRSADMPAPVAVRNTPAPSRSEDRLSVASGTESDPGLKFSTLLNDARSRGLTEEQRERLRQEQKLVAELDEKIIASLALAEKIRNMEGYLDKLQGDMSQLDQKIQSAKNGAATVAPPPAAQALPPTAPSPAAVAKAPAALPAEGDSIPWNYAFAAAAAGLLGWLWWRRKRAAEDLQAEPADDVAEIEEPAQRAPAVPEHTIISVPSSQRPPAAEPLSLDLEDHHEQDGRIGVAEHDSALELAEIMLSFGRVQGAAQTLSDYIQANPRQAIRPWLKLLEVYHGAGMRTEFEAVVEQFHRNFNVQKITWNEYTEDLARASLEDLPHLVQEVVAAWGSSGCLILLQSHLHDNREGTRMGFPLGVVDDIATLIGLLEAMLESRAATPVQAAA